MPNELRVPDDALNVEQATRAAESGGATLGSSGYFQTAQAKLIHCLRACVSFILGGHRDLSRQAAELIADVPAALPAI